MSPTPATAPHSGSVGVPERRLHQRYTISLNVEYKQLDRRRVQCQGFCGTIDISSRGVLLDLEHTRPSLRSIELSIRWPFLLGGSIPLQLKVRGHIVRNDGNNIAVEFHQHEFCTARTGG